MPGKTLYHRMKSFNTRFAANYGRGVGPTRVTLLLTTRGRKSGQARVTPLQYEEADGLVYLASARGAAADWYKNACADPLVHVQLQDRAFDARAEAVTDAARIADFIELRIRRHPLMVRLILHLVDRLPLRYTRADLERLCAEKAMLILHPLPPVVR